MHIVPFSVFQVDVGDSPEWLVAFAVSVHGSTNNQAATSPLLRRKGRNHFFLFCVKTPRWFVLARGSDKPETNNAKNTFNENFFFWFWLSHAREVPTRSKPGSNQPPNRRRFVATKKTCIQVLLNFQCFCSKFVAFFCDVWHENCRLSNHRIFSFRQESKHWGHWGSWSPTWPAGVPFQRVSVEGGGDAHGFTQGGSILRFEIEGVIECWNMLNIECLN